MPKYVPVIGLEIHAELKTKTKMFCPCANGYELKDKPNENICPICSGQPGALPSLNRQAVEWTILVGLALEAKINLQTKFDRKNYFYPDLPKGYQISQADLPLTYQGKLNIGDKDISITRVHLEEDTGKLLHSQAGSLIDLSRSSTPLIELVTDPCIESAQQAKEFCQRYQQILRYLEISDADMEKGQMRCEANVSLQEEGKFIIDGAEVKPIAGYKLNPKVELKNINSFRAVEKAIEYEIERQEKLLSQGGSISQETRGWDENNQVTFAQRTKETAADYRYFPEPDLPPLALSEQLIEQLQATLPELPQKKLNRFIRQYGFSEADAKILVSDKNLAAYTEQVISELIGWLVALPETEGTAEEIWQQEGAKLIKLISNWLINRLANHLNLAKIKVNECKITPENFAEFITLVYHHKVNNLAAQKILAEMFKTGNDPSDIMAEKDLGQLEDDNTIETIVDQIIAANPKVVDDYRAGKENALKFLIGQAMKNTQGKANPQTLNEIFKKKLT